MPFCPVCGREHAPGFAQCVDCRQPLGSTPPPEHRIAGSPRTERERPFRSDLLLWAAVGTAAGAGAGTVVGLGLALILAFTQPGADLDVIGIGAFALLGVPYGAVPGLLGGLLMAAVDPALGSEAMRKPVAALIGLGVGALFGLYYPPLLLLTGTLGPLTGWISAGFVTWFDRKRAAIRQDARSG